METAIVPPRAPDSSKGRIKCLGQVILKVDNVKRQNMQIEWLHAYNFSIEELLYMKYGKNSVPGDLFLSFANTRAMAGTIEFCCLLVHPCQLLLYKHRPPASPTMTVS